MRKRLTREGLFRRTAAPDEFSGRNMNTPITLYDTHPNKRFPVGSVVTFVDDKFLRLRGTVLGHAAEDRLWVQWPNEVRQMDTDEVVGNNEIQDAEPSNSAAVTGSRGLRKAAFFTLDDLRRDHHDAALLTFDEVDRFNDGEDEEDEELEYIPDKPDFLDGDPVVTDDHPTNEIHTGELPSEQDPRDKVEEDGENDRECESFELIFALPEAGDMTDLIENNIMASRREALWGKKDQPWKRVVSPYTGKPLYRNEAEAALNYNVFDDYNVQKFLSDRGLTKREIDNFADLRQHQLDTAKQQAYKGQPTSQYGFQKTSQYSWGQGTGVNIARPQQKSKAPKKSLPVEEPWEQALFSQQAPTPQQWEGGTHWPTASRSLGKLKSHVNLVGGLLAMPRTANVLRQTADLVSAVRELDNGKSLDETTRSALRNTSRNLLTATDHLKSVNNRIANMVAGEIEQLYVDALSN